jgi:Uma2 family endonuclease
MMLPELSTKTVDYLESDGAPIAETGFHVTLIAYFLTMLRTFFLNRNDVYVGSNMFMYYREDIPAKKVAPDLFVVFGVPNHERRIWKIWEEGKGPDVIFEFTSKSTWDEDLGSKKGLYSWLGVREYFLFDPLDEYLKPRLQGFHLVQEDYQAIQPGEVGQLTSHLLGLRLQVQEDELQLFRQDTNERLLPPLEVAAALEAAELEIARLQAELEQLREKK